MRKLFYPRLAASNIKKNSKTYVPYLFTCILTVCMFFMVLSLSANTGIGELSGASSVYETLNLGVNITGIFAVIFLFYTNSFLMKRRKKEFGLYNILGMEKKHISKVIFFETLFIAIISMAVGLLIGVVFNRLLFLLLLRIVGINSPLQFQFSVPSLTTTLIFFSILFLVILLNGIRQVYFSKPIELLKGGQVGEKEPKAKWVLALLGLLSLGTGYYLAVTTKDPVSAILLFFVAVILVIIGTYLLFTAGSIVLLKILKKNKRYYYKANHFISVSGMMYRMKQNAVGLANICILSTMVLVMISSTLSLYAGVEDAIKSRYPRDIFITTQAEGESTEAVDTEVDRILNEHSLKPQQVVDYKYLTFSALIQGSQFSLSTFNESYSNVQSISLLFIVALNDYNEMTQSNETLKENEVLLSVEKDEYSQKDIVIGGSETYNVKKQIDKRVENSVFVTNAAPTYFIVVPDETHIEQLNKLQAQAYKEYATAPERFYAFNIDTTEEEQENIYNEITEALYDNVMSGQFENKVDGAKEIMSMYGGFLFIGIFLGLLFIMATILIIYYKQVSEGYDDKERFVIMQNVGMSHKEVRKSIRSQVLTVFFLPLITAGVHVVFAFPMIVKILELLALTNTSLFVWCSIGCFLVFTVFYAILYSLTAKVYYKIVSK